jgi:amidase
MTWKDTIAAENARLDSTIPKEWRATVPKDKALFMSWPRDSGILTDSELRLTETNAVDLVQKLATGEVTSVAVTTAFCKRAALAQQLVSSTAQDKAPSLTDMW